MKNSNCDTLSWCLNFKVIWYLKVFEKYCSKMFFLWLFFLFTTVNDENDQKVSLNINPNLHCEKTRPCKAEICSVGLKSTLQSWISSFSLAFVIRSWITDQFYTIYTHLPSENRLIFLSVRKTLYSPLWHAKFHRF